MRREEKEIKDAKLIQNIFAKAKIGRIGLCYRKIPYVVPVHFGFKKNRIYFHSATEGRKIDIIKKNNNVCFEAEIAHEVIEDEIACNWSAKFLSIIASGKAFIIEDLKEKKKGLDLIMKHYSPEFKYKYSKKNLEHTLVVKIEIEKITGKNSGY